MHDGNIDFDLPHQPLAALRTWQTQFHLLAIGSVNASHSPLTLRGLGSTGTSELFVEHRYG